MSTTQLTVLATSNEEWLQELGEKNIYSEQQKAVRAWEMVAWELWPTWALSAQHEDEEGPEEKGYGFRGETVCLGILDGLGKTKGRALGLPGQWQQGQRWGTVSAQSLPPQIFSRIFR